MIPFVIEVWIDWRDTDAHIELVAPVGHHIADDAPVDVSIQLGDEPYAISVLGRRAAGAGISIPDPRGLEISGTVGASVCDDEGTRCERMTVSLTGIVPAERRGRVALDVTGPSATEFDTSAYRSDAALAAAAGFETARVENKRVLLDFTAIWCPPCNQMAVEVLDAPDRPAVLDDFVLVRIDADDPTSWTIKDRYAVGGYPTVIAVEPDGTEISRMLGYTNRGSMVGWLEGLHRHDLRAALAAGPQAASAAVAAEIAWQLVQQDKDPTGWLERAAAEPDRLTFRLARMNHAPNVDDAKWLGEHAPGTSLRWAWSATELEDHTVVRDVVVRELVGGTLIETSERLSLLAEITDGDARPIWGAAARTLQAAFTGDPVLDRPHYTSLARFWAESGNVDVAVQVLDNASRQYPNDPTFPLSASGILHRAGRFDAALARADVAYAWSWGDNRLRAAKARADALVGLGRVDEARAYVARVLGESPVPPEGIDVRTRRYREALEHSVAP